MSSPAPPSRSKQVAGTLLAAVLVGGAIRLYLAWTATVISRDGCEYAAMARRMTVNWRGEIPHDYPLGYPALILATHAALGDSLAVDPVITWQRCAQLVCVISGVACIPLVYWLGRRLLNVRCALAAAWIWALLPHAARISADALTDMPHLALVLASMALAIIGLRRRSLVSLVLAGLFSGAAFTMRTEAIEPALVAIALAMIRRRAAVGWRLAAAAAVAAGFAMTGGSYIALEGGRVVSKQPWLREQAASSHGAAAELCSSRGAADLSCPSRGAAKGNSRGRQPPDHVAASQLALKGRQNRPTPAAILPPLPGLGSYARVAIPVGLRPRLLADAPDGAANSHAPAGVLSSRALDGAAEYTVHNRPTGGLPRAASHAAAFKPAGLPRLLGRLNDSLNTIWLLMAMAYGFIPDRPRLRRRDLPLPLGVWSLHIAVLLWLFSNTGYISGRHVLILDVAAVLLAAGAVVSIADWIRSRHPAAPAHLAALMISAISLALAPWLLRDIGDQRGYLRRAGEWIAAEYTGRPPPRVASFDGRPPFYAGLARWSDIRPGVVADGTDLLIVQDKDSTLPGEVADMIQRIPPEDGIHMGAAERGLTIYRLRGAGVVEAPIPAAPPSPR